MFEKLKEYEIAQRRAEQYKKGVTNEYAIKRTGSEVVGRGVGRLERNVFVCEKYYKRTEGVAERKKLTIPSILRNKGKILY